MEQVIYYVVLHQGEWHIECNGHFYGPHRTKEVAINLAVAAAKIAKRDGDPAKVIVQGKNNTWYTEWEFGGNDLYSFLFA
jgi:hypothetical protein